LAIEGDIMVWPQRFWLKLQTLFRRSRKAQQLADEMQFHLDQQIAENIAAGMSQQDARYAAMRTFGNPTFLMEETRDTWGWLWLEQVGQDFRYGSRALAKNRSFTLVAVATLALGIGATAVLYSIFDGAYILCLAKISSRIVKKLVPVTAVSNDSLLSARR